MLDLRRPDLSRARRPAKADGVAYSSTSSGRVRSHQCRTHANAPPKRTSNRTSALPTVSADINREYATDPPGALTSLSGYDDWANLWYALSGHPNFGDGREETTIADEFDFDEFEANEQIPPPPPLCVADLTGDGVLDFFDVQQFLNYYASGDLLADFIVDGVLDFFDVQEFLNQFSRSCP